VSNVSSRPDAQVLEKLADFLRDFRDDAGKYFLSQTCGSHSGEEVGFEGEDGDGGEGCDDGDDQADADEFPESDFCAARGELQDD